MTTAAEAVAGIEYLLEEILSRIPAKPLTRFKLVSKKWCSHISNPQFVQSHSRRRPNRLPTGMFLREYQTSSEDAEFISFSALNPTYQSIPSLGFLDEISPIVANEIAEANNMNMKSPDKLLALLDAISPFVLDGEVAPFAQVDILNSCNGLLLCFVHAYSCGSSPNPYKFCVCNPTTKKFRLIPTTPFSFSSINGAYLAFDPSISLHYKVICTTNCYSADCKSFEIYIYSSEDQCWRSFASPYNPPIDTGAFLNGVIYWMEFYKEYFLCFDVYSEKITQIPTIPNSCYLWPDSLLAESGSHLYRIDRSDDAAKDFHVLEINRDFSEWVAKYDVNVSHIFDAFPEIVPSIERHGVENSYKFLVLCFVEGVKEEEPLLVIGVAGKVIGYNLMHKTVKELYNLQGDLEAYNFQGDRDRLQLLRYRCVRVFQFIETLYAV